MVSTLLAKKSSGSSKENLVPCNQAFAIERSIPHGHVKAILRTIRKIRLDTIIAFKYTNVAKYSTYDLRVRAVRAVMGGQSVSAVAMAYEVNRTALHR